MTESLTRNEHKDDPATSISSKHVIAHALSVVAGFALLYIAFFSPILFSSDLLAPGDGIIYFLPNFYAKHVLWDTSIWAGFPAFADSQLMMWYPPALVGSLVFNSWNTFLLSAYVMASSFTYGYVYTLTRSRFAAIASGTVFGMCGFMVAHIGHAAVIHAAAWIPLVIWSFEMLARRRERLSGSWFAIATLAIACAALAGHPQIFTYTLMLGASFAVYRGSTAQAGRWRYYFASAATFALGIGLAAVQLVPTAELARLSLRASLTYEEFNAYQLPLKQVPMLLLPLLYGGAPGTFYRIPYFGEWASTIGGWGVAELVGYVGLLPLMLAAIGFITHRQRSLAWFWLAVAVCAFFLTLGDATPLARLTYHLPIINKFRVPARHFIEMAFAVSVLAGLGINAIRRRATTDGLINHVVISSATVMLACLCAIWILKPQLQEMAIKAFDHPIRLKPWANPAMLIPLLVLSAGFTVLLYWHKQPASHLRFALLILVIILDLSTFTWFYEWHYGAPYKVFLRAPVAAEAFRAELDTTHQRLLPVRGGTGRVSELPPDLSKLWGYTSASGYGPFILTRVSRLLTMPPHGSVDNSWRDPANQSLDLMSVRYVFVPHAETQLPSTADERGIKWTNDQFGTTLGHGCNTPNPDSFKIDLPMPVRASSIGIVSALACSGEVADNAEVARLLVRDINDQTQTLALLAGRDTSEWAYDCADVRPAMKQERAPLYRSHTIERAGATCEAHDYVALLHLPDTREVKSIEVRWTGSAGTLALKKFTLIDEERAQSTPLSPLAGSLDDATRWRHVAEIGPSNSGYGEVKAEDVGECSVYQNLRARPRAWLVPEVLSISADDAVNSIRTSRLPDGRVFAASQVALVEEPYEFKTEQLDLTATAQVVQLSASSMDVETNSAAPAFLITSDVNYPGWRATIDGAPAHIYQTDYAFRGVALPAGLHRVRFGFQPQSFYYGLSLSAFSLLLLGAVTLWLKRNAER